MVCACFCPWWSMVRVCLPCSKDLPCSAWCSGSRLGSTREKLRLSSGNDHLLLLTPGLVGASAVGLTFPGHPRVPAHGILWRHAGSTPPITCLSDHPPTNYPPTPISGRKAALTPRAPSLLSPTILAVRMANPGWTTRACIAAGGGAGSSIRAYGVEM